MCFTAFDGDAVVGALALAEVPGLLGPRRLVSLPFGYAAGPVASSAAVETALLSAAREEAETRRLRRLEIKRRAPGGEPPAGFVRNLHYSTYVLPVGDGEKAVWARLHPSSTQRGIRKSEKEALTVSRGGGVEDWTAMARLEEDTARRHGLPAPPRAFFLNGCRRLQEMGLADVYIARLKTVEPAAGIVVWKGPREWIYAFGASRPDALAQRPNHLLLWTAIRDAMAAGAVSFDLGRAAPEQGGLVEFKRRWGGEPVPLAYDYWPSAGGLNVADRSRGTLALAARVWSALPEPVTRMGSFLYRYLG
ncbi:MAG: GNAT family N-acetyltransferase [Gemmatimonadota bacterium]